MKKPIRPKYAVCSVHNLVDGDTSVKMCRYCGGCNEWICDECWGDTAKRAKAAAIKAKNHAAKVIKNGVNMIKRTGQKE